MDLENSIQYVKDFISPKTPKGWLPVAKANFPNPHPTSFGHGSSKYANEILACLQNLMKSSTYIQFGVFPSSVNSSVHVFYILINTAVLRELNRVIPKCFIQVLLKIRYSGVAELIAHEKRFNVSDLDKNGSHLYQPVLDTYNIALDSKVGDVTAGVFVRWPESNTNKIKLSTDSFLQNLFGKESSKDLRIVAGNGAEIECHRIVFEAHSDVLTAMLSPENGLSESKTGRVELNENSEEGIRLFIRYLYGMELITNDLSADVTIELFQLAHKYELKELEDRLSKFLLMKESDWFRPDSLLELYFHVKHLDDFKNLHDHALTIIIRLSKEVRKCERFKELNRTDSTASAELLWTLFDLVMQNNYASSEFIVPYI